MLTTVVEQCETDLKTFQMAGHCVLAQMTKPLSKAAIQKQLLQFQDKFERSVNSVVKR